MCWRNPKALCGWHNEDLPVQGFVYQLRLRVTPVPWLAADEGQKTLFLVYLPLPMAVGFHLLSDISQVGEVQPKREARVDASLALVKVHLVNALSPAWHIYGERAMEPITGMTTLLQTAPLAAGNRSQGWVWEQKYSVCVCVCVVYVWYRMRKETRNNLI